jgi:hypothetical protein
VLHRLYTVAPLQLVQTKALSLLSVLRPLIRPVLRPVLPVLRPVIRPVLRPVRPVPRLALLTLYPLQQPQPLDRVSPLCLLPPHQLHRQLAMTLLPRLLLLVDKEPLKATLVRLLSQLV